MLRHVPSVSDLLKHAAIEELIEAHGRAIVTGWVRQALSGIRDRFANQTLDPEAVPEPMPEADRSLLIEQAAEQVTEFAHRAEQLHLRNVINATGIILHTGLGRAPLSAAARQAISDVAAAANVEVDVETGQRRHRGYQVEPDWQLLTGCEDALIVNNNAAATLLTLQALCARREVIISRGELIEIGGSFRLPEIFELSGARLKEVGTTNRTTLADYERAIGPETAAIMHVHPSNFRVVGFVGKPDEAALFALAHQHGVLAIDDIGSGALFDVREAGLPAEPTFQHSIASGADVVLGSGDKLLGGPQCGIILGRSPQVAEIRRHPLARAVRVGKLTIAALGATLDAYVRGAARSELPTVSLLCADIADLRERAESIVAECGDTPGLSLHIREDVTQVGGGSLPAVEMPTIVIALRHRELGADALARQLRTGRIRVFSRIQQDEVILDLRSVLPEDASRIALAVRLIRV